MRPFLTLHHPAAARRYYAQGTWRDETFYALLARHAAERAGTLAAAATAGARLTWTRAARLGRWHRRRPARQRAGRGRRPRLDLVSNRLEAVVDVPRLLARGHRLQSVACTAPTPAARSCNCSTGCRRASLLTEPGWGADRARADFDAMLDERRFTAKRSTRPRRCRRPSQRPLAPIERSRQGRLPRVHVGHHRCAEVRHAFGQFAARQCPRSGARLGPRSALRCCSACRRCRTTSPGSGWRSGWWRAAGSSPTIRRPA